VAVISIDQSGSFPRVATKRKTKVSVGFEWEIPAEMEERECYCYDDCNCEYGECECYCDCEGGGDGEYADLSDTTCRFMDTHGFRTHYECGGAEFASPVFGNITTARRVARAIKEVALQDRALGEDVNPSHCCGIHVHTSHVSIGDCGKAREVCLKVNSMLNRKSSAKFIMEFSGRTNGSSCYLSQAQSIGWDANRARKPSPEKERLMSSRQMVRQNGFGSSHTIEYRLWHTAEDRLLPAIDFAHACTTFIMGRKDIPYLKDFKKWLDKQSGYKILKQDNAWRLL
jgi:hypothetical protein